MIHLSLQKLNKYYSKTKGGDYAWHARLQRRKSSRLKRNKISAELFHHIPAPDEHSLGQEFVKTLPRDRQNDCSSQNNQP
jgi:hypothetical protein